MFKLGKRSRKNMIGLKPSLAFAIEEAIKISKQDFGILDGGGVRTQEYQDMLYAKGRTKSGKKVTWTRNSKHILGQAADLVAFKDGKPSWDKKLYKEIIKAMKIVIEKYDLDIDNGYDLWKKDLPHWQDTSTDYDIRKYK